jgi:hypothetical protein
MQTPAGITTNKPQFPQGFRNSSVCRLTCCLVLPALLAVGAAGCKSGTSMGNSWWSFGMGGPDAATLAEAPPFEGDLTKPSATATPYPTTSTPESYAIAGGETPAAGQQPATAGALAQTTQPPVTYGTTPSPATSPSQPAMTPPGAGANAIAANSPEASVGPQVGPYQTIPSTAPPASAAMAPLNGMADRPASEQVLSPSSSRFGLPPAQQELADSSQIPPPARSRFSSVADQRVAEATAAGSYSGGSRFSSPPAVTAPVAPMLPDRGDTAAAASQSRYGEAGSSAFVGGGLSSQSNALQKPLADSSQPAGFPEASQFPGEATGAPIAPRESPQLPAPPPSSRRRDPGYRPFGTSSYRAAEPIYADRGLGATPLETQPITPGGVNTPGSVKPASFDAQQAMPAAGLPQAMPAVPSISGPPVTSP